LLWGSAAYRPALVGALVAAASVVLAVGRSVAMTVLVAISVEPACETVVPVIASLAEGAGMTVLELGWELLPHAAISSAEASNIPRRCKRWYLRIGAPYRRFTPL
jgi:hypothetical protein